MLLSCHSMSADEPAKDLDIKFKKCVAFLHNLPPDQPFQPTNSEKIHYHALIKQATLGPCNTAKPTVIDVVTRAKWEAWAKLGSLPKDQAKLRLIADVLTACKRHITPETAKLMMELEGAQPTRATLDDGGASVPTYVSNPPAVLQIYVDLLSQPSRAVIWFCLLAKIPHELKITNVIKGEQFADDYKKLNPFSKVPTIVDTDGFVLYESHSIMRYLATRYKVDEQWYPVKDVMRRIIVERYLDWHHLGLRKACMALFQAKVVLPSQNRPLPALQLQQIERETEAALKLFDCVWLKNTKFLAGDSPTIADISATCELTQLRMLAWDFSNRPNLKRYLEVMAALPYFQEVHRMVNRFIEKKSATEPTAKL